MVQQIFSFQVFFVILEMEVSKRKVLDLSQRIDLFFAKLKLDIYAYASVHSQKMLIELIYKWQMAVKRCLAKVVRSLSAKKKHSAIKSIRCETNHSTSGMLYFLI